LLAKKKEEEEEEEENVEEEEEEEENREKRERKTTLNIIRYQILYNDLKTILPSVTERKSATSYVTSAHKWK